MGRGEEKQRGQRGGEAEMRDGDRDIQEREKRRQTETGEDVRKR